MPARLSDLIRAAARFGVTFEDGKGTSHAKFRREGMRAYVVPAGNGRKTEISDVYIRALCRNLGIEEDELRKLL